MNDPLMPTDPTVDAYTTALNSGLGGSSSSYIPTTSSALIQQEGVTKWLQNPKEIIREITIKLKGLEYDKTSKRYVKVHNQLLTDEGIEIIIATLNFHINKTITLSNIDEKMVNDMALEIHIALASALHQNWVRAGLIKEPLPSIAHDDKTIIVYLQNNHIILARDGKIIKTIVPRFNSSLYKVILNNLDHIIYANLRRAKDGGERNFLKTITTEQIQQVKRDDMQQPGGGLMNKFLGVPSLFKK